MWINLKTGESPSWKYKDAVIKVQVSKLRAEEDPWVAVHISGMMEVVKHMLQFSVFGIGGLAFQQVHGACIGSPIAPIICIMVVTLHEALWVARTGGLQNIEALRYVDNRASFVLSQDEHTESWLHDDFYVPPIQLESEGHQKLLGSMITVVQGVYAQARYVVPAYEQVATGDVESERWRYKSEFAANVADSLYGTVVTRLLLSIRGSSSKMLARAAVAESALVLCRIVGPKIRTVLIKALHKVSSRKDTSWPKPWLDWVIDCVKQKAGWPSLLKYNEEQIQTETQNALKVLVKRNATSSSC